MYDWRVSALFGIHVNGPLVCAWVGMGIHMQSWSWVKEKELITQAQILGLGLHQKVGATNEIIVLSHVCGGKNEYTQY